MQVLSNLLLLSHLPKHDPVQIQGAEKQTQPLYGRSRKATFPRGVYIVRLEQTDSSPAAVYLRGRVGTWSTVSLSKPCDLSTSFYLPTENWL